LLITTQTYFSWAFGCMIADVLPYDSDQFLL
jgi:hypothetical protein